MKRLQKTDDGYDYIPSNSDKKQKIKTFGIRQNVANKAFVELFLESIKNDIPKNKVLLEARKRAFLRTYKGVMIENRDIIAVLEMHTEYDIIIKNRLFDLLQKRAVRTISGVSPIGILTKAYPCPGKCVYCPTEARMPKSYMSNQPAAARALRNKFHPYDQVKNRIEALSDSGHPTSKLEVIVMGGTWSFLPIKYQQWYIKRCFDAANNDDRNKPHNKRLEHSLRANETAEHRIIGLTLETRPDYITPKELQRMREYGCTRIEIGVQTLDDEVSRYTKRGHTNKEVIKATRLMKDFGFKICYHLMPGLPGSTVEKDLEWMKRVFTDSDFRPDFIKLYPCVVLKDAELRQWYEDGRYTPMTDNELIKLLLRYKSHIPEYCRVMRLMRDIPVGNILGGAKFSNLRQILHSQPDKLKEILGSLDGINIDKWPCKCIRCREVGFAEYDTIKDISPILVRRDYVASGGEEVFLSYESPDKEHIYALLRLRKPSGTDYNIFTKALSNAALIREVHSYGTEISVGEEAGIGQHRGLGRRLIKEAERIAKEEWGMDKMTIIAGVGTKEYYRKWGYEALETYMVKHFT